jgi:hypothetical protein
MTRGPGPPRRAAPGGPAGGGTGIARRKSHGQARSPVSSTRSARRYLHRRRSRDLARPAGGSRASHPGCAVARLDLGTGDAPRHPPASREGQPEIARQPRIDSERILVLRPALALCRVEGTSIAPIREDQRDDGGRPRPVALGQRRGPFGQRDGSGGEPIHFVLPGQQSVVRQRPQRHLRRISRRATLGAHVTDRPGARRRRLEEKKDVKRLQSVDGVADERRHAVGNFPSFVRQGERSSKQQTPDQADTRAFTGLEPRARLPASSNLYEGLASCPAAATTASSVELATRVRQPSIRGA